MEDLHFLPSLASLSDAAENQSWQSVLCSAQACSFVRWCQQGSSFFQYLTLVPTGPDPQELGFLPRSWGVLWVDRSRASRTSKKNLRAAFCPPTPGSYCLSSPANFILSFISQSGISKLAENANLSKWEQSSFINFGMNLLTPKILAPRSRFQASTTRHQGSYYPGTRFLHLQFLESMIFASYFASFA